ncbi:outer membrane protein assembly factor BamD [Atopomonas hussainii]|uniref:Outer membrane protein assembly factor BamD n=1 Tax=Atopomonas hussainii TaxID=1429083 RepID=A0A1H7QBL8_9GAMM|nr:outer membrane protein assembly factor BamD [Atopomonas hussainii]SEL45219.1 outer membrane protein assembly factor BamD [Atopomonas hussainii]
MPVNKLLLIAALALIAACSSKTVIDENLTENELYAQAQEDLGSSRYSTAIEKLKALESRYPFGRYAEQAQLELIYAYFKSVEPEAARAAADRFIRLHPQHPSVDYAYYIKGLSSFEQDRGLISRFIPLDMTKRDPGAARDSFNEFAQLTSRSPNSRYAPDAKARMIYLRNLLAAYEVHAGDYYLKRKAYVAAANRGRYIVENFQGTPAVGDGLAIMTEAYHHLGMQDLKQTSLDALKLNYPEHPSLDGGEFKVTYKQKEERSWLYRNTVGLFDNAAPLPPGQTRASQDVIQQYEDAEEAIPGELKEGLQGEEEKERSWFSYLTFGLFD